MPVGNNNIVAGFTDSLKKLSCFSTKMSTLHNGSLVRQESAKFWTNKGW